MTSTGQQASQSEAHPTSTAVRWPAETGPRNPQASYYGARYYDPTIGRFLSEDPIGFNGGEDFYSYVGNGPLSYLDPAGLMKITCNVTYHDDGWYGLMQGNTNIFYEPPRVKLSCECAEGGKFKLTIDLKFTIYVDAGKGWQTRHEKGHVDIFENYMNS
jgi:RHS repeat-associated protein